jgi:hypothetical protein
MQAVVGGIGGAVDEDGLAGEVESERHAALLGWKFRGADVSKVDVFAASNSLNTDLDLRCRLVRIVIGDENQRDVIGEVGEQGRIFEPAEHEAAGQIQ